MAFWNKKKDESDTQEYSVSYSNKGVPYPQDPYGEFSQHPRSPARADAWKSDINANEEYTHPKSPANDCQPETNEKLAMEDVKVDNDNSAVLAGAPKPLCVDCKHCYKVNSPQHMCKLPVINLVTGGELAKNTLCIDERLGKRIYENLDNCGLEGKFYKSRVEAC